MPVGCLFVLFSFLLFLAVPACGQTERDTTLLVQIDNGPTILTEVKSEMVLLQGFISINCGIAEGSTYKEDSGIVYSSDAGFIETGVSENLPQDLFPSDLINLYNTVRSFPNGTRNCYRLKPVEKGNKYLVRAYFLYGNYDGKDSLPQFDLYLDVNLWKTISFSSASEAFFTDVITEATMDFISVCLVNTSLGTPFISALELRPLKNSMYIASNETQSLVLFSRHDLGAHTYTRYPDDPFDLIWEPFMGNESWTQISTTLPVETDKYEGFDPPSKVMETAVKPANEGNQLRIHWSVSDPTLQIHVFHHFAELEKLKPNMTRELEVCYGDGCLSDFHPEYLVTSSVYSITPLSGQNNYSFLISKTANSTLPPILNAYELYTILELSNTPTKAQEVEAMIDIKTTYKVKRNWMGDPCLPKDYRWEGLTCNYPDFGSPTITSLNMSSTGLDGEIAGSLANLTSINSLDLSGNKLSGPIPDFLGDLPSLSFLNFSDNQLNGTIPSNLQEKSSKGLLKLSIEGNPNLNVLVTNNSNKDNPDLNVSKSSAANKKKLVVPIVATVASTVILLIVLTILWTFKRRKQDPSAKSSNGEGFAVNKLYMRNGSMRSENRRFTYTEVIRITDDFERIIGNGGFGTVYHGEMRDGTQVAVKMLSLESVKLLSHPCQGSNEFQNEVAINYCYINEVQLLVRVHHKNLVSFIGFCKEGDNMALIYEYMSRGNLASYLSATNGNSKQLSWHQRLRIALDVAQGLEYLHNGCKPPIIHRDMKTTNILLNEKLEAKIGDFGLSKAFLKDDEITHVSTAVKGTHGYLDPEYCISNNLTEKSDVYSFGVVLLQIITGQPAILQNSDSKRRSIIDRVKPVVARGDIQRMVDPRLESNYDVNSIWKVVEIALACTAPRSIERPTMSEVVAELKGCLGAEIAAKRNMEQVDASSSISFQPLPR